MSCKFQPLEFQNKLIASIVALLMDDSFHFPFSFPFPCSFVYMIVIGLNLINLSVGIILLLNLNITHCENLCL